MVSLMARRLAGVAFSHPRIMEPLEAAAKLFNSKHPEIEVQWQGHPLKDFEELSLQNISKRFDLFAFDHPHLGEELEEGSVLDLESLKPGISERLQALSLGLSLESYKVGGKLFGVPFDGAVQSSAWVRENFQNETPPRNMSELQKFVVRHGRESVALPLLPAHAGCTFLSLTASVAPLLAGDQRFYLQPARVAQAFQIFSSLVSGSSTRSRSLDPIQLLEEMSQGSGVQYSPFVFGYGTYSSGGFCKIPLSFGPSLSVGRGINRAVLGGAGIGVSAYSENRDAALEFAEFVMSGQVMPGVVGAHRGQGGLLSGWGVSDELEMNEFFFSSTQEAMEAGIVRPRFAGFVKFLGELGDRLNYWVGHGTNQDYVAAEIQRLFSNHCDENPDLEADFGQNRAHVKSEAHPDDTTHEFPTNNPLSGESEEAAQK